LSRTQVCSTWTTYYFTEVAASVALMVTMLQSDKHPAGHVQPAVDQVLLNSSHITPPTYDPVLFEQVIDSVAALHTQGSWSLRY